MDKVKETTQINHTNNREWEKQGPEWRAHTELDEKQWLKFKILFFKMGGVGGLDEKQWLKSKIVFLKIRGRPGEAEEWSREKHRQMEIVGNVSDPDEFTGIHYIKNMNKREGRTKPNDDHMSWIKDYSRSTFLHPSPTTNKEVGVPYEQALRSSSLKGQQTCNRIVDLTAIRELQR